MTTAGACKLDIPHRESRLALAGCSGGLRSGGFSGDFLVSDVVLAERLDAQMHGPLGLDRHMNDLRSVPHRAASANLVRESRRPKPVIFPAEAGFKSSASAKT